MKRHIFIRYAFFATINLMNSILEQFSEGKIKGFSSEAPEIIITTVSRIFVFPQNKRAFKIYRRDNDYWNRNFFDLSGGQIRKDFIKEDFKWNRYFNPEVYLGLKEARLKDDLIFLSEPEDGDELIIEMAIIDRTKFLIPVLASNLTLDNQDFYLIGQQFASLKKGFREKPKLDKNWLEIFNERIQDLRVWMEEVHVPADILAQTLAYLADYLQVNRSRFEQITENEMVGIIDAHGENAMYDGKKLSFIDIFLPKALWRLGPKEIDFFRIGLDIYVLRGEEAYRSYLKGIGESDSFSKEDEFFYLVYLSALMSCIQSDWAQNDKGKISVAEKYQLFFESCLGKGEALKL